MNDVERRSGVVDLMGYVKSDKARRVADRRWRLGILVTVLVLVTAFGILHQYGGWKPVGADALCPFGGIETLWALLADGGMLQRIALSSLILLGAVVATALVFKRSFCGHICPLGTVQELFGRAGRLVFRRRPEVPEVLDRPARYLKYAVLAVITLATWRLGELVIRPYDPWVAWQHLSSPEVFAEFGIGLAVLGVSVAGSVVYDRFFCKYACPMGAALGLMSRLSLFKVRRDADACTDCGACDRACPSNIKVSEQTVVSSAECIDCKECLGACPAQDALYVGDRRGTRLTGRAAMWSAVSVFAAIVAVTTVLGLFEWTQPSLASELKRSGGIEAPKGAEPGAGPAEPVDVMLIKGRMTMREVAEAYGIAGEEFRREFGVSDADMGRPMKDLRDAYEWNVDDVRAFVAEKFGQPAPAPEH